jgi:hypothetical protein
MPTNIFQTPNNFGPNPIMYGGDVKYLTILAPSNAAFLATGDDIMRNDSAIDQVRLI